MPASLLYRVNWIKIYGQEYHPSDFVLCGWQTDDLPVFAKINAIIILVGTPLFVVEIFKTTGVNNHLLSYAIEDSYIQSVLLVSKLVYKQSLSPHQSIGDSNTYIALRSHCFS